MLAVIGQYGCAAISLGFFVAAFGKFDARGAWLGLVDRLAPPHFLKPMVAVGIPVVEAAVAALCLIKPRVGAAAASLVLLLFAISILVFLGRLRGTDCACFGRTHSSTVGVRLAVRNVALALVAGLIAIAAVANGMSSVPATPIAVVFLGALIASLVAAIRTARADLSLFPTPPTAR